MELIVDGKNVLKPVDLNQEKNNMLIQRDSVPTDISFCQFNEKNWLFDAHVTGAQGNELVTQIQSCFKEVNAREIIIFKEIDTLLRTIEAIHKGSIEGIVAGIKSAQNAIEQSDYAIEQILQTLEILEEFKTQLEEGTEHLKDIDCIWDATIDLAAECDKLENSFKEEMERLQEEITKISLLMEFREDLLQIKHLSEIDEMHEIILSLEEKLSGVVDKINSFECIISDISNKVSLREKSIQEIDDKLEALTEKQSLEIEQLKNKINMMYYLLGGTASVLVIQIILNAIGII